MEKRKDHIDNRSVFVVQHPEEWRRLQELQTKAIKDGGIDIELGIEKIKIARAILPDTSYTTRHETEYGTSAPDIVLDLIDTIIKDYYDSYSGAFQSLRTAMQNDEKFQPLSANTELRCGERFVALCAMDERAVELFEAYFPKAVIMYNNASAEGIADVEELPVETADATAPQTEEAATAAKSNQEENALAKVLYEYLPGGYDKCTHDLLELLLLVMQKTPEAPAADNQPAEEKNVAVPLQQPIKLPWELRELLDKYHTSVNDEYVERITKMWDNLTERERCTAAEKMKEQLNRQSDYTSTIIIEGLHYVLEMRQGY